jgi:hypothetical protein
MGYWNAHRGRLKTAGNKNKYFFLKKQHYI